MEFKIVLIRNYKLTSLLIHAGMFLYCILRLKKPVVTYNHLEIEVGGYSYGAIAEGVRGRTIEKAAKSFGRHKRKEYIFNADEWRLNFELHKQINKPYQFRNFLQHAIDIFCDQWFGYRRKKALDKIYCYELGFYILNSMGILESAWWKINPYNAKKLLDEKF